MAPADTAVGMMDAAYFIGRRELLDFFNDLLQLNLSKIEQTASGAIACQLTEMIFPGSIPMNRVNWEAKSDYEYVQNYKLLQVAFTKQGVQRHVDVDKLIRAKYQDNLEFCQWLKAFYDQAGVFRDEYDPVAVRARGKGGHLYNQQLSRMVKSSLPSRAPVRSAPPARVPTAAVASSGANAAKSQAPVTSTSRNGRPLQDRPSQNALKMVPATSDPKADAKLIKENTELEIRVGELEQAVIDIEKERDFYFEKLRHVEVVLQVYTEKGGAANSDGDPDALVDKLFKIMYATAENSIFVTDEGNVLIDGEDTVDFPAS